MRHAMFAPRWEVSRDDLNAGVAFVEGSDIAATRASIGQTSVPDGLVHEASSASATRAPGDGCDASAQVEAIGSKG